MGEHSTPQRNPYPSSAETVATNDDLLNEILLRLPIRSLLNFKTVSKHWLSLITNPHFVRRRTRTTQISKPSGLFLQNFSMLLTPQFDFIPLKPNREIPTKPPFRTQLRFVGEPSKIWHSCNGLLLCQGDNLYIYNPTTNEFTTLPYPPSRQVPKLVNKCRIHYAANLAFDPSKSPHYKVVHIYWYYGLSADFDLEIYSSETGLWTTLGGPLPRVHNFRNGVFWNGALHWIGLLRDVDSLYFNIEEERFVTMPNVPPVPDGWEERRVKYFGNSSDHLQLIEIYGPSTTQFNVYEMERDYSEWLVKFRVDLDTITNAFPEMIFITLDGVYDYKFVILGLIWEEKDDDESFLVLHIPGKIIRYNFRDNSFNKLFDLPSSHNDVDGLLIFDGLPNVFEYIESLAYV
ncbi:unnamed protein product [Camellia sinensis]